MLTPARARASTAQSGTLCACAYVGVCPEPWSSSATAISTAAGVPCPHCSTPEASSACGVDRARAVGHYQGALKAIVHALKYDGRRTLARPLAELMRVAGAELIVEAAVAVPVPLKPLPIGVQIIAAPWKEDIALRIAQSLEELGIVSAPRPPLN